MSKCILVLIVLTCCAACDSVAPTPGPCVVEQKANPYRYLGQPITVCVCPDGAEVPPACQ